VSSLRGEKKGHILFRLASLILRVIAMRFRLIFPLGTTPKAPLGWKKNEGFFVKNTFCEHARFPKIYSFSFFSLA